jgi:ADP-ribosyl-[dinitrogen reductase] hydrolase
MDILKDKYYGLTIGCAVGDTMGSAADILLQEGSDEAVTTPEMGEGYWNEGCTLMLCQAESLNTGKPLVHVLKQALETGVFTSTGDVTNLSLRTMQLMYDEKHEKHEKDEKDKFKCKHNTDCLPPIGAVAMYYLRDYKTGHIAAYNNELATGCRLCMDACKFYHAVLDLALHGATKKQMLTEGSYANLSLMPEIRDLLPLDPHMEIFNLDGTDNVVSCLRMVLHIFSITDNIAPALTMIVNSCPSPVRAGALLGQLSGAYYGLTDMKEQWLDCLKSKEVLTKETKKLLPKIERRVNDNDKPIRRTCAPSN